MRGLARIPWLLIPGSYFLKTGKKIERFALLKVFFGVVLPLLLYTLVCFLARWDYMEMRWYFHITPLLSVVDACWMGRQGGRGIVAFLSVFITIVLPILVYIVIRGTAYPSFVMTPSEFHVLPALSILFYLFYAFKVYDDLMNWQLFWKVIMVIVVTLLALGFTFLAALPLIFISRLGVFGVAVFIINLIGMIFAVRLLMKAWRSRGVA